MSCSRGTFNAQCLDERIWIRSFYSRAVDANVASAMLMLSFIDSAVIRVKWYQVKWSSPVRVTSNFVKFTYRQLSVKVTQYLQTRSCGTMSTLPLTCQVKDIDEEVVSSFCTLISRNTSETALRQNRYISWVSIKHGIRSYVTNCWLYVLQLRRGRFMYTLQCQTFPNNFGILNLIY